MSSVTKTIYPVEFPSGAKFAIRTTGVLTETVGTGINNAGTRTTANP